MKRFVVLLILLAGGLAAAAFVVPSNAASVDGVSISQQQFNSDLHAIAKSPGYQCFLDAEEAVGTDGETSLPSFSGTVPIGEAGSQPTVTAAFAANYLNTVIAHQVVFSLAASRHLRLTRVQLATGRQELIGQVDEVLSDVTGSKFACTSGGGALTAKELLASLPSSFVATTVRFDATVNVLEDDLSGVGSSEADLQRYFTEHRVEFDDDCFTVAEYASETDAEAAESQVAYGTSFGTVAEAAAAANGQSSPQVCAIFSRVAASLPAGSITNLALNTVSNPIADGSNYLVLEITSQHPVSYATARDEVIEAVQSAGATRADREIEAAEKRADVSVDRRYGRWRPASVQVIPPVSPAAVDVLNPSANGLGTTTSTAAPTGRSS